jgi:hypothetical protein
LHISSTYAKNNIGSIFFICLFLINLGVYIMAKSQSKLTLATNKEDLLSDINSDIALQGEDFYQMVSEAAYYRAEKRDFVSGYELEDWVAAEAEILALRQESLAA